MFELSIAELLQEIRRRPAVYIGSKSLKDMAMFVRGFSFALKKNGIDDKFMMGFQRWIEKKFHISVSRAWEDIVAFHCGGGDEAMDYFFVLLDEYQSQEDSEA